MISTYDDKLSIPGSLSNVFKFLTPEIKKGQWIFKSGQPLPDIKPGKYILKSIQCSNDNLLNISILFKGMVSSMRIFKTFSLCIAEGVNYYDHYKTSAECQYALNLLRWKNITPEVVIINQKEEFDFIIHYETNS